MAPTTTVTAIVVDDDPQNYEDEHVHSVYDEIAPHFSSTRYKPWPIIAEFLNSIPTGWVGLDSGTGNGKYLPLPLDRLGSTWTIGLDRSKNLLSIARTAGDSKMIREVVLGDALGHSWRLGAFDYVISIATIHHLSTAKRRELAVQRLIECISPSHGRALIYVWAIEQDDLSKRSIPLDQQISSSGQDVFVPWVLSSQQAGTPKIKAHRKRNPTPTEVIEEQTREKPRVYNRYYHMFAAGELSQLVRDAAVGLNLHIGPESEKGRGQGIEIVQDGWERSNYYVELRRWTSN